MLLYLEVSEYLLPNVSGISINVSHKQNSVVLDKIISYPENCVSGF